MFAGWLPPLALLAYAAAFLGFARYGDAIEAGAARPWLRKTIYALSSAVTFGFWSSYGAVGTASRHGVDFLPLFIGPMVIYALFHPVIARMIRIARVQKITSIADFIAGRYGRSVPVAATVTIVSLLACLPFLAVQIEAIVHVLVVLGGGADAASRRDTCLVALVVAALAIVVGTRRVEATENQNGLMTALAGEALLRVLCLAGIGIFVCWGLFGGIGDLTGHVARDPRIGAIIDEQPSLALWLPVILMTMGATLVAPRQFHVAIVENREEADVRTAAWLVPLSLAAMALFVLPIAVAGLVLFSKDEIDRDFTLLAIPMKSGHPLLALVAVVAALSASIGTMVVGAVALAVMVCNDLVVPLMLWSGQRRGKARIVTPPILAIRRVAIASIFIVSALVALRLGETTTATIGLSSIVYIVQLAPPAIGALIWSGGTARGAIGGMVAGLAMAAYTLFLPALLPNASPVVILGPLGLDALRPTDLFGVDLAPLQQGVVWSLVVNVGVYIALSLSRQPTTAERLQANVFVRAKTMAQAASFRLRHANVAVGELMATVARFVGAPTAERLFREQHIAEKLPFDRSQAAEPQLLQYAERLIATTIGAASARMVISLVLEQQEVSRDVARQIVDDAAFEIQNSRDLLQHAIDIARDGMAVFDAELRLIAWNRAYREMFRFPQGQLRVGVPLEALIRSNAERGIYGKQIEAETFVTSRLDVLAQPSRGLRMLNAPAGRILEMRSVRLHNGGLFFTYSDATAQVQSEEELEAENETLERRVRERTEELERLNIELARAKAEAEDANITKSRFLAAANHDVLQPLSAARLYASSLRERLRQHALVAAALLHLGKQDRRDGGHVGGFRTGDAGHQIHGAQQDVVQAAAHVAQQRGQEADHRGRHARHFDQRAKEDEQGHGQKDQRTHPLVHPTGHDQHRHVRHRQQIGGRRQGEGEGDGHAQDHAAQQNDDEEQDQADVTQADQQGRQRPQAQGGDRQYSARDADGFQRMPRQLRQGHDQHQADADRQGGGAHAQRPVQRRRRDHRFFVGVEDRVRQHQRQNERRPHDGQGLQDGSHLGRRAGHDGRQPHVLAALQGQHRPQHPHPDEEG